MLLTLNLYLYFCSSFQYGKKAALRPIVSRNDPWSLSIERPKSSRALSEKKVESRRLLGLFIECFEDVLINIPAHPGIKELFQRF